MNKEEILERIKVCEKCEDNYRKVNRLDRVSAFSYEKIKWENLLSKLEKTDSYKQALIDIRNYCKLDKQNQGHICYVGGKYEGIKIVCDDILQIIDKVLGDEK